MLMLAGGIFLSSCEKEALVEETNSITQKKISYLEFADHEEFAKALENEESNVRNDDFVSMLDIYIKIEETKNEDERNRLIEKYKNILIFDKDSIIELIVVDPVLASFLTPDGLVKVGNEISLVEFDKIKTITDGDISKIELLSRIDKNSPENNIKVIDFIQIVSSEKHSWQDSEEWDSHKKKLKWKKWASYNPWNSSVGGSVKSYKKTWLGWVTWKTSLSIHVRWDYIRWGNNGYYYSWFDGHIQDNKNGWWLTERRYTGGTDTPNPVSGLTIDGSVGGHNFNH